MIIETDNNTKLKNGFSISSLHNINSELYKFLNNAVHDSNLKVAKLLSERGYPSNYITYLISKAKLSFYELPELPFEVLSKNQLPAAFISEKYEKGYYNLTFKGIEESGLLIPFRFGRAITGFSVYNGDRFCTLSVPKSQLSPSKRNLKFYPNHTVLFDDLKSSDENDDAPIFITCDLLNAYATHYFLTPQITGYSKKIVIGVNNHIDLFRGSIRENLLNNRNREVIIVMDKVKKKSSYSNSILSFIKWCLGENLKISLLTWSHPIDEINSGLLRAEMAFCYGQSDKRLKFKISNIDEIIKSLTLL